MYSYLHVTCGWLQHVHVLMAAVTIIYLITGTPSVERCLLLPLPASPGPAGTLVLNSLSVDQLTVAWAPPTTGGVPTSYNVSINDSSSPVVIPDNGSSLYTHTFTGLTSDTLYTVSVVAINCAGTSNGVLTSKRTCKCII